MASPRSLAALATLFALVGCGGGGGGASSPPPPSTPSDAVLGVSLSGGAAPGIDHLWVTVTGVALNASATLVFGDGDPSWTVITLAAPVTVDLADPAAAAAGGGTIALFRQSVGTLGNFAQLRLILAPSDPTATLAGSASARGLHFNDQVQYTDAGGAHVVPLETPDAQAGLRLLTPFNLSSDTTTPLAIEMNGSALVRRASVAGADRFTLRDELQLYNQQLLTALGGGDLQIDGSVFDSISGQLDTTQFCQGASHAGCIHDVVASATSLAPDSRFHAEVRSVGVSPAGTFLLYPLPGQGTQYDVVIHGGNMQTIVVHDVFVDPTGLLKPAPTFLSSAAHPLVPVLDTAERSVSVTNAITPASSRVFFGQTVADSGGTLTPGVDVPYTIVAVAADPATGRPLDAITLPGGPIHYASFDSATDGAGTPPAFTTVTPTEGIGGWSVWTQGTLATRTSATRVLAAGAGSVTAPDPGARAGFGAGTLTVTLSGASSNGADHAELIVSNDGGTATVVDVTALIGAHGGTIAIGVPSGSSPDAPAAAIYGVALRTWVVASETTSARWARAGAPIDLSTATTATVSLALP